MHANRIVSHEDWLKERLALLAREKDLTNARDALAEQRRNLPWVAITKPYVFQSAQGARTLGDLFEGRSQLVVYHFMFGPEWKQGCKSCSFWVDNLARTGPHLAARDVLLCLVSRAPLAKLQAFGARMGWTLPWVSSHGSDFNVDFGVSFTPEQASTKARVYNYGSGSAPVEAPGLSVFARDEAGALFHTYSTYGRGLDPLNATYQILDLVPKGRNEAGLDWPMQWVRLADEYLE